jgi:hypothetical protein
MATAVAASSRRTKPSPAALKARRATAQELLDLNIKLAPQFKHMADLEATLKQAATDIEDSFKEDFGGKGYVSASGAVAAEFKGNVPQIQTEIFLSLPKLERTRLEKMGVVQMIKSYGKASNGRITVKVL